MKKEKTIEEYFNDYGEFDIDAVITEYNSFLQKLIVNMKLYEFSQEDKQDIIANTFYIVMNNVSNFKKEKLMSSYLAQILQILVKEKETVQSERASIAIEQENIEKINVNVENIDILLNERNQFDRIGEALNISKDVDKQIYILKYLKGLSNRAIGINLHIEAKEVSNRLSRLNKKIKRELSKGGYKVE